MIRATKIVKQIKFEETWSNSEVKNYFQLQKLIFVSLSLLTARIVKNSHILTGIYFIFLKKHSRLNLKGFQYEKIVIKEDKF